MKKEFPTLYAKAKTGKTKQWKIWVEGFYIGKQSKDPVTIYQEHGYTDGKKQLDQKIIDEGKNIGKSNETTPWEQACMDAESRWKKKLDRGYTQSIDNVDEEILLPMLAQSYDKMKHKIEWPCYVQPKLNGVRCLASPYTFTDEQGSEEMAYYLSRKGKYYETLDHLTPDLHSIQPEDVVNTVFDGEIYIHGETFQEIVRRVKKDRGEKTQELQYWIYDQVTKGDFRDRFHELSEWFRKTGKPILRGRPDNEGQIMDGIVLYEYGNIVLVPTIEVEDEKEMMEYHGLFIQSGFEGTIIRNKTGEYLINHRSSNLQKYKDFQDTEYPIVGISKGTGREAGAIIYICETDDGKEFKVRPKGTIEQRKILWNRYNGHSLNGKQLTVRYQELSEDGVPIFPVGIIIRDYEI